MPLVGIKPQSEPPRPLLPVRHEVATLRVVEIKPAHDRKAVRVFAHRRFRQLVRIRVPQHRVDQRPVDAGRIHAGDRLLGRIGRLAVVRRRRAFFPEMDLSIDDQHRNSLSCSLCCCRIAQRAAERHRRNLLDDAGCRGLLGCQGAGFVVSSAATDVEKPGRWTRVRSDGLSRRGLLQAMAGGAIAARSAAAEEKVSQVGGAVSGPAQGRVQLCGVRPLPATARLCRRRR